MQFTFENDVDPDQPTMPADHDPHLLQLCLEFHAIFANPGLVFESKYWNTS